MGKLVYLLLTVIAVQLGLLLVFDQAIPGSSLWALFSNPSANWNNLSLINLITDSITALSAATLIIGTFWIKYDFLVFAGMTGIFFTFGKQLANAWQSIADQTTASGNGGLIASIIVFPIIILYILTILEFWRGIDR